MTVSHPIADRGGRRELRRPARTGRTATGRSHRRSAPPCGTGPDPAAVHSPAPRSHRCSSSWPRRRRRTRFVASFRRADGRGAGAFRQTRRQRFAAEAERIVAAQIYPAWKRAIAVLQPLEAKATDDAGLWRFKDGAAVYAEALRAVHDDQPHRRRDPPDRAARGGAHREGDGRHPAHARAHARVGQGSRRAAEEGSELSADRGRPRADHGGCRTDHPRRREARRVAVRSAARRRRSSRGPFQRFREANAAASYTVAGASTDRGRGRSRSRCGPSG